MKQERVFLLGALLVTALLPFVVGDYWLYLLSLMGAYGVVALGLNLLTGLSGQMSLGHAGFFAIGAYVSAISVDKLGLPFLASLLLAIAAGWLIGLVIGFPAVRLRGLYLAIATLAFGIGTERAIYHFKGLTGGPFGLTVPPPEIFGFRFHSSVRLFYLVLAVVFLAAVFYANISRTHPGRMLIAIRDSEVAATSVGVNIARMKILAFAISAGMAALGGALYAPIIGFISVEHFTLWLSISFVSMIVVGGLGSSIGSFLGAAFVVLLPEVLRGFGAQHQLIYGLAMILVFVFWPRGLVGLVETIADKLRAKWPGKPSVTYKGERS